MGSFNFQFPQVKIKTIKIMYVIKYDHNKMYPKKFTCALSCVTNIIKNVPKKIQLSLK